MFADDMNIFFSDTNLDELIKQINAEIIKLSNWFKVNKLSLNVKKTKLHAL